MKLRKKRIRRVCLFCIVIGITLSIRMIQFENIEQLHHREAISIQHYLYDGLGAVAEFDEPSEEIIEYNGVLEIPKIGLKRGFMDMDSPYNDVSYNIMVIDPSDMPDTINGNLIMAAHSGNSSVSFFKELDQLTIGDIAIVYYRDTKYTYQLFDWYEMDKDGFIRIKNYDYKTLLTLTTCSNVSSSKQLVFLLELVSQELFR